MQLQSKLLLWENSKYTKKVLFESHRDGLKRNLDLSEFHGYLLAMREILTAEQIMGPDGKTKISPCDDHRIRGKINNRVENGVITDVLQFPFELASFFPELQKYLGFILGGTLGQYFTLYFRDVSVGWWWIKLIRALVTAVYRVKTTLTYFGFSKTSQERI